MKDDGLYYYHHIHYENNKSDKRVIYEWHFLLSQSIDMRYLHYFIYLNNQTYWQTTVTEPGWSSRQDETLFRRSNIHVPHDGTLSVFHSVIDTTHMALFLFVSYIRYLLYICMLQVFTKNKMKETATKINFRRFDFIMTIPRSIFSFILYFCLHWISENHDLNNVFCCSTASWMCTLIKYVILPIIYPTFFNIFHYKSRMNVSTKKIIMVLYLFFVILR
jgi:hypothetical protein